MQKNMKLLAVICILTMLVSMFAACGSSTDTTTSSSEETATVETEAAAGTDDEETQTSAEDASDQSAAEEAAPAAAENAEPEQEAEATAISYDLPLAEEVTAYSIWSAGPPGFMTSFLEPTGDYQSAPFVSYLEETTGIRLDYTCVNQDSMASLLSLMVASGEYTDLISDLPKYYAGGAEKAYADDVIIDMTDYVLNNMPAYLSAVESTGSEKDALNDDGQYLTIYGFYSESRSKYGPQIRKDWLDELGLDVPVTYDDWYEVGIAFLNEFGPSMAYYFSNALNPGAYWSGGYDLPAFDLTSVGSEFYQIDGVVKSAYAAEEMKDYIKMMAQWYEDGLISKDFITAVGGADVETYIRSDNVGAYFENSKYIKQYNEDADLQASGFYVVGTPVVVQEEGQITHFTTGNVSLIERYVCVTTACDDVDLLVTFLDWLFTEDGQLLTNYGIEGETYYMDDNGEPQWIEATYNNPDGYTFIQMTLPYIPQGIPTLLNPYVSTSVELDEESLAAEALYGQGFDGAYDLPSLSLTEDETERYSALVTQIDTYASEYLLKCVVGTENIDETWDTYLANLEDLGLSECLAIQQAAYDRYLQR